MLKKKLKPEAGSNPVKTVEIPVENISVAPPIPQPKEIVLEKGKDYEVKVADEKPVEEKATDHELFHTLLADVKRCLPTEDEKRRMQQQLKYCCPESVDLLTTIVKVLSRL